ncbi:transmembrane protein 256 homolog [Musca domestica]|uniref:Transmembrane protein 256 homolog n=1 Tax=Musca domestica TaxID=7370 RepID=A0A1I8MBD7_MUSDO|nr:transmembrane protein 256 homolog [Musca domestica]XP_011292385.1 transmembrane protein 256 homolog [Musca domestica]
MTITDGLHYIAVGNPLSKAVIGTTSSLFRANSAGLSSSNSQTMSKNLVKALPTLWELSGRNHNFVRLAGLSGAAAVILGAVGSHHAKFKDNAEMRAIFDTANRFHFFHSIALLGVPLAKYPMVSGALMVLGTALFSGCLYYRAFTGNKPPFARMAPMGGTCLIVAWLSFML